MSTPGGPCIAQGVFPLIKPPQVLLVATALFGCATQDQDSTAPAAWSDCVITN